jgi:serine/threonine protein kinase
MQYGKYLRTAKRLGAGGNGEVWLCTSNGEEFAVKVLARISAKRYARFKSEIGVLASLGTFEGVVPLVDHEMPTRPSRASPAWYAMPVVDPNASLLETSFNETVAAFI